MNSIYMGAEDQRLDLTLLYERDADDARRDALKHHYLDELTPQMTNDPSTTDLAECFRNALESDFDSVRASWGTKECGAALVVLTVKLLGQQAAQMAEVMADNDMRRPREPRRVILGDEI